MTCIHKLWNEDYICKALKQIRFEIVTLWDRSIVNSFFDPSQQRRLNAPYELTYSISQEICTRFCFAVLCCGYTLTDFPISIRLTSLALWQTNDCPSASKAILMNMDKYFMWIHYERLHNHNKAKHNKTVCLFLGVYCTSNRQWLASSATALLMEPTKHLRGICLNNITSSGFVYFIAHIMQLGIWWICCKITRGFCRVKQWVY